MADSHPAGQSALRKVFGLWLAGTGGSSEHAMTHTISYLGNYDLNIARLRAHTGPVSGFLISRQHGPPQPVAPPSEKVDGIVFGDLARIIQAPHQKAVRQEYPAAWAIPSAQDLRQRHTAPLPPSGDSQERAVQPVSQKG
jgi:hypothetical protein